MSALVNDIRYGIRMLLKKPSFTAVIVLTLALGIGANTAIFSIIDAMLLRPLPYPDARQLVTAIESTASGGTLTVTYPNFLDWRERQTTMTDLSIYSGWSGNLTGEGVPEQIVGLEVSASYAAILSVDPIRGRFFNKAEDSVGGAKVTVISEGLWKRKFAGDEDILGKTITLDGNVWTIIGVVPESFQLPFAQHQVWLPAGHEHDWTHNRGWHQFGNCIGRMKPGVTFAQAEADLQSIAASLAREYPKTNEGNGAYVQTLRDRVFGADQSPLWILFASVVFVLLIACANIANLLLARSSERTEEIAVRSALGAGSWRLVRQLFVENLVLAFCGGAAGLLIAYWAVLALQQWMEPVELVIDGGVLFFTLAITVATGIAFGFVPALSLLRSGSAEHLKSAGRSGLANRSHSRVKNALILGELAVALILLVGAGLMIQSFRRVLDVPLGIDHRNILLADLNLPTTRYSDGRQQEEFYEQVLQRVRAIPAVQKASVARPLPVGTGWVSYLKIEGESAEQAEQKKLSAMGLVDADYFTTLRIGLIKGRYFNESDDGRNRVCIINERFEEQHFHGDALGKRFNQTFEVDNWMTVVGVVRNVKYNGPTSTPGIHTYLPLGQTVCPDMGIIIKTTGNPLALADPLRAVVGEIDSDQPVANIRSMESVVRLRNSQTKLATLLFALFASVATTLAVMGIYSVISFSVASRSREFGIRMALGATYGEMLLLVLSKGVKLIAIGITVGLLGAFALTRVMAGLLFEVSPLDPWVYSAVAVILTVTALAACYVPARRAAKTDPMEALRYE